MSKEVKRYFVEGPDWELIEDEIGDLVEHEAYKALLEENQRLESAWKVDVLNRKDELIAKQEKENDRVKAERDALLAELDALKKAAQRVLDGLNARIDAALMLGGPVPVFEGIADLHDALQGAQP
ncbi:hypothetical protein [Enterococcus faecalis]|uniref:hypothetical protein n=1 Tax=Enterococcus faecalis TaxID=1351 RepID=UPI003CE4D8C8